MDDVLANIVAFEAMNNVRIEIRMSAGDRHGRADMLITMTAHDRNAPIGDRPSLGSASMSYLGLRLASLEAALIRGLYQLDSMLADNELREENPK